MKPLLAVVMLLIALMTRHPSAAEEPAGAEDSAKPITWPQLSSMPLPPPGTRISYGEGELQFGELRVPGGEGPFPVFVLIHGGCWQNAFDYLYMTHLAAWLTEKGVATWTIEYRRLGDEGGGWPGTFLDVANATDALRKIAENTPIDTTRIYAAGHSAGGQLALWLASRSQLPSSSELYLNDPLPIRGVLGLAAITDLTEYRVGPPDSCHSSVEPLLGGTPDEVGDRYAETSPAELLPLRTQQIFIQGGEDPIVSAESVGTYVSASEKVGDNVTLLQLPSLGHFDPAVPTPQTEGALDDALHALLSTKD